MANAIVITDFDSEVTLLYKYVEILERPAKYIVVTRLELPLSPAIALRPPSPQINESPRLLLERLHFESVFDVVERKIGQDQSLAQIYSDLGSDITPVDIAMVYYSARLEPTLIEGVLRAINRFYSIAAR